MSANSSIASIVLSFLLASASSGATAAAQETRPTVPVAAATAQSKQSKRSSPAEELRSLRAQLAQKSAALAKAEASLKEVQEALRAKVFGESGWSILQVDRRLSIFERVSSPAFVLSLAKMDKAFAEIPDIADPKLARARVKSVRALLATVRSRVLALRKVKPKKPKPIKSVGSPVASPFAPPEDSTPPFPSPRRMVIADQPLMTGLLAHAIDSFVDARRLLLRSQDLAEAVRVLDQMTQHLSDADRELWLRIARAEQRKKKAR